MVQKSNRKNGIPNKNLSFPPRQALFAFIIILTENIVVFASVLDHKPFSNCTPRYMGGRTKKKNGRKNRGQYQRQLVRVLPLRRKGKRDREKREKKKVYFFFPGETSRAFTVWNTHFTRGGPLGGGGKRLHQLIYRIRTKNIDHKKKKVKLPKKNLEKVQH